MIQVDRLHIKDNGEIACPICDGDLDNEYKTIPTLESLVHGKQAINKNYFYCTNCRLRIKLIKASIK